MTEMTEESASAEAHSRAYYDIAQLLESADDSEARVLQVLHLLHALVPYEECAVLEALPDRSPRLITPSGTTTEARAELGVTTAALLRRLVEDHGPAFEGSPGSGTHLAVPLVGLDSVLGVLFVRGAEGSYEERHVRALSVVAAKLAAYLSLLNAFVREAERAQELAAARQAAEAADRAKDEFLALVSHELRTPLSSILAWADALRSQDLPQSDRERAVNAIERSVQVQGKLISDLLDLSCVSAATLRLDLRAVEPAKVLRDAIKAVQPDAAKKAIRLELSVDESVTTVVADPRRFNQIVLNLVRNAIKFTPDGGRVEVRLERAGTLTRLRVADSGPGIPAEILPKVFEPFNSADTKTTRARGGLGIGLALVKDLVALHGGSVRAESSGEKKGSIFTVELPLADIVSANQQNEGHDALAGIRVLIVDDDKDIGEVLQFVLEREGAVVTVVTSSAEALAALELSMPDVLLSDIAMPGESGYDLMRKIVARKGPNALPAAALSAYTPGRDFEQAQASGFRMLLGKPIDSETLIRTVAALATADKGGDPRVRNADGRRS